MDPTDFESWRRHPGLQDLLGGSPKASIDNDNYYYLYGKRMRAANQTNELVRSGKFRVSGWNPDGSERLMPVAPDNLEWVAWDAIRSRQDRQDRQNDRQYRKRLEAQLGDEGREAKRARFGDG